MRQSRTPYMSGSPYPTGRSPFSVDLSGQIAAVTQQMVQNRQQEIKEKKLQISESEDAILTALDFKTLEGAGDKFTLEQADRLKNLTDKWAGKWKDGGGVLTTKDKIELLKDKRDVESKLAVGSAELKQYQEWQKELSNPNQKIYDTEPMLKNMAKYAKDGLLGTGGLINQAVLKKYPLGSRFAERYRPFMQNIAKEFQQTPVVVNPKTGATRIESTNKPAVDRAIAFFRTTQEYADNPEEGEAGIKNLETEFLSMPSKAGFSSVVKPKTGVSGGAGTVSSSEFPDLKTKAEISAAKNYNDFAERVWQGDESALQELKGDKYKDIQFYDDKIVLTTIDTATGNSSEHPLSRKMSKIKFKEALWDWAPDSKKQGLNKNTISVSSFVKEDWELDKPVEKTNIDVEKLKRILTDEDTPITVDGVVNGINKILPDAEVIYDKILLKEKNWYGKTKKKDGIIFNGKPYDIDVLENRKKLQDDVMAEYEKQNKEAEPEPEKNIPKLTSTKTFNVNGDILTAQELVDKYIESGLSEVDAINKVNSR